MTKNNNEIIIMNKNVVLGFFGLLVALAANVHAATMAYNLDNVVWSDPGPEIINGNAAEVNVTVVTSDGKPFTLGNIAGADAINVTAKFTDDLGTQLDVTGDGVEDTFYGTETATAGTYTISINTSAQPGEYTLLLEAVAYNSTTGEVVDSANASIDTYIADPYWVTVFVDEGEEVSVANFKLKLESLTDRGALIVLNNQIDTVTPDSNGVMVRQVDLDGDGVATDWLFIESTDSGVAELKFYSKNNIIPDKISDEVSLESNTVKRNYWLKYRNRYRQVILWDKSPLSWIKSVDYYIIPSKNRNDWKVGWGRGQFGKATIVKRTTYFGIFTNEEKIYEGNIFGKNIKDDAISIKGKWAGTYAYIGNGYWEVLTGICEVKYPSYYEAKFKEAATVADLEFRGKIRSASSKEEINWDVLLSGG